MNGLEIVKDVFEESFPALKPETRAKFKLFLTTHNRDYKWLFSPTLNPDLTQGDIFVEMPAFYFDKGDVLKSKVQFPAILLQHTCDMSIDEGKCRNPNYVAAPLFPVNMFAKKASVEGLKQNNISHKLFLGTIPTFKEEYFADLNMICSISAEWLQESLSSDKIRRVASLSDTGYFFFLAKITTHLLRADR